MSPFRTLNICKVLTWSRTRTLVHTISVDNQWSSFLVTNESSAYWYWAIAIDSSQLWPTVGAITLRSRYRVFCKAFRLTGTSLTPLDLAQRYYQAMALQLLLETHTDVTSIKSIDSIDLYQGQRVTIVLLPYTVILINVSLRNKTHDRQ